MPAVPSGHVTSVHLTTNGSTVARFARSWLGALLEHLRWHTLRGIFSRVARSSFFILVDRAFS